MGEVIYGVSLDSKVTPLIVRDAIITCFKEAHSAVLDMHDEYSDWENDAERERFRSLEIELVVKDAFKRADFDFEKPTKEGIMEVLDKLKELAEQFRSPEIVQKHYSEILKLVEKLE